MLKLRPHVNFNCMSTLSEIETAVEALPRPQQEQLFAFLSEKIRGSVPAASEDKFAQIIGAFAGPRAATGRQTEEILYGSAR